MNEKYLLEFLIYIAEEDAQISTITVFFINQLGYEVNTIKDIVEYGVNNNILRIIENDEDFEKNTEIKVSEIDWSISNVRQEIYYNDIEYYRGKLLDTNPKIPDEFRCFIKID